MGQGIDPEELEGAVFVLLVRPGAITPVPGVIEAGGRWGCMAGEALMDVGVDVMGLRVGEVAFTVTL